MQHDLTIYPIFARHETFHPRFGWLKKGFDKATDDVSVFSKESAPVVLGVGKNMVKAIRYWCVAFKIVDELKNNGKNVHHPTNFAKKLLGENGWDPFLEDPASLWLLHWNLFKPPCNAPVWHFTFTELNKVEFSSEDILFSLKEYKNSQFPNKKISDSSLKKDVNCLLRMYTEQVAQKNRKEESLACPFTDLGIINTDTNSKRFVFKYGDKPTLPSEMIVSACLEFASSFEDDVKTVAMSRLLYDAGSPGQAFKLNESSLSNAIESIAKEVEEIHLTDAAGMMQIAYDSDPLELSAELLDKYYKKRN